MSRLHGLNTTIVIAAAFSLTSACKPPAVDENSTLEGNEAAVAVPSAPIPSPDSEGAIWSSGEGVARIIYGQPGSHPYLALACENSGPGGQIRITRFAPADEGATAFLALVGNSHVARIPVDSTWNGQAWIWEGRISAHSPNLEVLTGRREATAMVPGAGEVRLNPSHLPAQLISECRGEPSRPSQ